MFKTLKEIQDCQNEFENSERVPMRWYDMPSSYVICYGNGTANLDVIGTIRFSGPKPLNEVLRTAKAFGAQTRFAWNVPTASWIELE